MCNCSIIKNNINWSKKCNFFTSLLQFANTFHICSPFQGPEIYVLLYSLTLDQTFQQLNGCKCKAVNPIPSYNSKCRAAFILIKGQAKLEMCLYKAEHEKPALEFSPKN